MIVGGGLAAGCTLRARRGVEVALLAPEKKLILLSLMFMKTLGFTAAEALLGPGVSASSFWLTDCSAGKGFASGVNNSLSIWVSLIVCSNGTSACEIISGMPSKLERRLSCSSRIVFRTLVSLLVKFPKIRNKRMKRVYWTTLNGYLAFCLAA